MSVESAIAYIKKCAAMRRFVAPSMPAKMNKPTGCISKNRGSNFPGRNFSRQGTLSMPNTELRRNFNPLYSYA